MSENILVCVVTYNPDAGDLRRLLEAICRTGRRQLVWDNSDDASRNRPVPEICAEVGIECSRSDTNLGTAAPLNYFAQAAKDLDAEWLLYLDQDSVVGPGFADHIGASLEEFDRDSQVAVICALGGHLGRERGPNPGARIRSGIASGSLYRVSALWSAGGFDETMVLDLVDIEMCYRLRSQGYGIVAGYHALDQHTIGESPSATPAFGSVLIARHPRWRRRLMWRNSVVLMRRYTTTYPGEMTAHLVIRCIETLVGAARFRAVSIIVDALRGFADGVLCDSRRRRDFFRNPPLNS